MPEEILNQNTTDPAEPRTFSQEEVTALCAKEAGRAERAILKAFGLKDKGEIQTALEKLSAAETTKGSLDTVTAERDRYKEKFEKASADYAALAQKNILAGYGVTDQDEQEFFAFKIGKQVTEDQDFASAAKSYFAAHPVSRASVKLNAEGGNTPNPQTLNEIINRKLRGES
ncbi:MAG: hypothetical protein HFK04_03420 [Oscillospiraceae bacterium]|nr:hypothetical protein [Oscillospiraceae bacterium]